MNQKKGLVLATIGLLWGGILAWEWLAVEEPVRVPLTNVSGLASTARARRGTIDGLHVQLDDMGIVESIHLTAFHWVVGDLHRRISL